MKHERKPSSHPAIEIKAPSQFVGTGVVVGVPDYRAPTRAIQLKVTGQYFHGRRRGTVDVHLTLREARELRAALETICQCYEVLHTEYLERVSEREARKRIKEQKK